MQQRHWFILTTLVGVLVAAMIISDLTTKTITRTNDQQTETVKQRNQAMEIAEEELGLQGGDTLTGPARALRLARAAQQEALKQQRLLKEQMNRLNQMNMGDLGADSLTLETAEYE
ncbi:hypothetical protein KKC97_11755 [bacterium]|nr:hypothetical protein [bacterium]MBU1638331.1 hypothetical protein [bacterium]RQV98733.1 MAG: hypothetical protein EH220_02885 [bacterium]